MLKYVLAGVVVLAACGSPAPNPDPVTSTTYTIPEVVLADFTPEAQIKDAAAKVEQAHEGLGNVLKHNIRGDSPCDDRCTAALDDARSKTVEAYNELGADILGLRTWDNNQTVGHAFDAAIYWLKQTRELEDIDSAEHAEYQLGILRDILGNHVSRLDGETVSVDETTTTTTVSAPEHSCKWCNELICPNIWCILNCSCESSYSGSNGTEGDVVPCLAAALRATSQLTQRAINQIEDLPADQRKAWEDAGIVVGLAGVEQDTAQAAAGDIPAHSVACNAHATLTEALETGFPAQGTPIANSLVNALVALSQTGYDCTQE